MRRSEPPDPESKHTQTMSNLTQSIGTEIAKIGQGLQKTMEALKEGEKKRMESEQQ